MKPAPTDPTGRRIDEHQASDFRPLEQLLGPLQSIDQRLGRLEDRLAGFHDLNLGNSVIQEWLTTADFAAAVGRAEFTVRTWCTKGRLKAEKTANGREWRIHRDELLRYRHRGLLPA